MTAAPGSARREVGLPSRPGSFVSFDGGVRQVQPCVRPDRYRQLEAVGGQGSWIVRGGCYSYAAAGFGGDSTVIDLRRFDRVLDYDAGLGVLTCEAGMTLGKLHEVAAARGGFVAVQPGYPGITVGGCVAADVHGKNPLRDGTFRRLVEGLRLYHPSRGFVDLDRERQAELFDLTCGGLGLTGVIVAARIRLARQEGTAVVLERRRIARLEDTLELLEAHASRAAFAYTWQNLTCSGAGLGRGYLYLGSPAPGAPGPGAREPASRFRSGVQRSPHRSLPLLGAATAPLFNAAYEAWQAMRPARQTVPLYDALFPVARKMLYFDLFGRAGFHEVQILVPRAAFPELARRLRRRLASNPVPVTLASCKLFDGEQTLLRFDGRGICLALDFPRGRRTAGLLEFLDGLVGDLGGIPNLVKDSRLPRRVVERCYPELDLFRQRLRRQDPERLFRSELSERLGL